MEAHPIKFLPQVKCYTNARNWNSLTTSSINKYMKISMEIHNLKWSL